MSVSTGRGQLRSQVVLAWTAHQPCACCVEIEGRGEKLVLDSRITLSPSPRAVQVHHYPHKGMGGAQGRDDRVIPLCQHHHAQAHRGDLLKYVQAEWAAVNLLRFLDEASQAEVRLYMRDLERWKEQPRWIPV